MESEWPEREIGSFATVKGGKRMPAGTALISSRTLHPYLRVVDFKTGGVDDGNLLFVPEDVFPAISRYTIKPSDVYISIVGTIGLVGQIPDHLDGANLTENAAKISCTDLSVNPKYLAYFLRSSRGQRQISAQTVGSTQPKLALFRIANISVAIPPPSEQQAIVDLLGVPDGRIDLLRQTNTTLEAIAQALFKSWFVDFDPVHAKAEGREPEAMDAATAALFPSEFEASELGLIPKGWRVARLSDLVELAYGKALKASDRVAGEIPVYGSGGITGWHDAALVKNPTIIVGRKGSVGTIYWEDRPCYPIDTVFFVRPKEAPLTLCLQVLRSLGLDQMNTDAAVPGLNRENAYRLEVVVAPAAVSDAWHKIVEPIYAAISNNSRRYEALSQLRDTLLPRLISGKLRLPEAEREFEATT